MGTQQPHRIVVVSRICSGQVVPAALVATVGDQITWKAVSPNPNASVIIFFPNPRLFPIRWITVKPGTESDPLTVGDVEAGEYPYAVFCESANAFAEGASSPIIIIQR